MIAPLKAAELPNPDSAVKAMLGFQAGIPDDDKPWIVGVSFWDIPEKELWDYRRYLGFWCNQMSFERALRVPQTVPGTEGRLCWLDLRWYGWNQRAWRAVAEREPYTREPWIFHRTAEALRQGSGYKGVQPQKGEDGRETTPAIVVVNGGWFIRETLESDRSPSYYDLLFARFRYPEGDYKETATGWRTEKRTVHHQGGDYTYPDDSGRISRAIAPGTYTVDLRFKEKSREAVSTAAVDFPKDIQDWEKAFGIDKLRTFARETQIDLDYGAVVAGGRDDPERGSIVALNNRLLVIYDGPLGKHMRSYDVFKTHADRDYSEKLIFKKGHFRKGDGADAVFDAGEILSYLPNGGQAGFLIDGEGKRQEIAGTKAANDVSDKRLNPGVRNFGSCLTCHAASNGFIVPKDQEKEDQKLGIKRKFKDKDQEARYQGFFAEWEEDAAASATKYQRMIARTTGHPDQFPVVDGPKAAPWTGAKIGEMTGTLRDRYDDPVTPERAARMVGVPVGMLKYLASRGGVSPDYKVRNHRLNQLVQGKAVPANTWESDVFRQAAFLLDAYRDDPEVRRLFGPK
jgi:hypothetical protein